MTGRLAVHLRSDATAALVGLRDIHHRLVEPHRPVQRPYPGAPGFVLTHCPACDGRRERVQLDTEEPAGCEVWRDAQGVQRTSSVH